MIKIWLLVILYIGCKELSGTERTFIFSWFGFCVELLYLCVQVLSG